MPAIAVFDAPFLQIPLAWIGLDRAVDISLLTLFGLIGNLLFSARVLVQWIASERSGRSVVPVSFWWISLVATLIHIVYAYARDDIPMILGSAVTLIPYVRNLRIAHAPDHAPRSAGPLIVLSIVLSCAPAVFLFGREEYLGGLFWFGLLGNVVYRGRFFVQWVQSETQRRSVMTLSFWYVSLLGSLMLLAYALLRGDFVFILSFLFNVVPYGRNVILIYRHRRIEALDEKLKLAPERAPANSPERGGLG
ncbi:MAG TPA: lipid-A-disaccharide synthase N-terminal domain-containing protein [Candidatus Sumerlaeota bacterium]|nr:MAG: lipid-A-disaccharide synthase [candidate division BRC1 bacterium ADurb.BinA292]HOE94983.1 lipid-A-disaccharide synthase N-terminal domain-containing protein [Candidatus Sumerlaeota bacterium]HOR26847.1 lipid-A-disaccharide synthase N-terminal domain-containing protein [Candidatus Sumerlaeota bacterium]HPK01396.1 lipid-A-disaccharide synthase N-terminal domain-containing protein [Candidatus Sumerlaeota bacterium]